MIQRPQTHDVIIDSIEYSLSGNVIMMYCRPQNESETVLFKAGQFMLLAVQIDGVMVKRSYSIATSPVLYEQTGLIGFSIKKVPGGIFSVWVTTHARVGDSFTMTGGLGHMIDDNKSDSYVLISAGSGLSPIYSLYTTLVQTKPHARIAVLFGERKYDDMLPIIHTDWTQNLREDSYIQCFLSQDQQEGYKIGRVQAGLDSALQRINTDNPKVFICGSPQMVTNMRELCEQHGISKDAIIFEQY